MKNLALIVLLCLIMFGCRCPQYYCIDNGKTWKKKHKSSRFTGIKEQDFVLSVNKYSNELHVNILTKFNASPFVKERGVTLHFEKIALTIDNGPELKIQERKRIPSAYYAESGKPVMEKYFTCDNFQQEIRKSNILHLSLFYRQDSSGVTKDIQKSYVLVKKQDCYFSVH